jgi:two-component system, cell cycle response regulator
MQEEPQISIWQIPETASERGRTANRMEPAKAKNVESAPDTWVTAPRRVISKNGQKAYLVHIYPTNSNMGMRYALQDSPVVLGRGEDCDIRINDHSVSRRHARIEPCADGYYAIDLQSTNGTFVNDVPSDVATLKDGDYLRIGNCIYRFLAGGNVESEYHEEIYRLTIIDALTGIHNKRFMVEFLDRELARSARHGRPLSVMIFDIDHFKVINDELGHLAGDVTLRELAGAIKANVRREDLFARYGGEEFALVLVETTHQGAGELAERLRRLIEKRAFQYEGREYHLTISIGLASTSGNETLHATDLIRRADENLYQAKNTGRNRVVG